MANANLNVRLHVEGHPEQDGPIEELLGNGLIALVQEVEATITEDHAKQIRDALESGANIPPVRLLCTIAAFQPVDSPARAADASVAPPETEEDAPADAPPGE